MSATIVIDLIHENPLDYTGKVVEWNHTDHGKRPVIKPFSTSITEVLNPLNTRKKEYPYFLKDEHCRNVSGVGIADVVFLIPDTNIHNFTDRDYQNSFYTNKIQDSDSKRVQRLREEIDELEDERNLLRKKLDRKVSEEEEENSQGTSGPPMYECSFCSESSRKTNWRDEDQKGEDLCPGCGQGTFDNATKVS
jgi:hypothetical protein